AAGGQNASPGHEAKGARRGGDYEDIDIGKAGAGGIRSEVELQERSRKLADELGDVDVAERGIIERALERQAFDGEPAADERPNTARVRDNVRDVRVRVGA